jgi:hypothetical protein
MSEYEKKLRREMNHYLSLCTCDSERGMVVAICEREIEEKLKEKGLL